MAHEKMNLAGLASQAFSEIKNLADVVALLAALDNSKDAPDAYLAGVAIYLRKMFSDSKSKEPPEVQILREYCIANSKYLNKETKG